MQHRDIIIKWLWKPVKEPWYDVECVAWSKKYCEERGYPIKSFWGSAINWWETWSPFDDSWIRYTYKPWMCPSQWDILFWSEARCLNGHTWVANKHCTKILRYSDTNGNWKRDPVTNRFTDYKHLLWWFHKL